MRGELNTQGYRIVDGREELRRVLIRKSIRPRASPAGPNGAIQFPILAESELIGGSVPGGGYDYRDQPIAAGFHASVWIHSLSTAIIWE